MKKSINSLKLLIVTIVAFGFVGCSVATSQQQGGFDAKASSEVKKLINDHKLEVVGYDYVLKAIGDGTRKNARSLVLDARPFKKYKISHIPSAMVLPDTKFDKLYDILFGKMDKNKEIIVYCGGYKCSKSPKVALKLMAKGHKNVKVYIAGLPEWKTKNYVEIDKIVAKAIFDKRSALFLDARPWGKFMGSTITGAMSLPDTKYKKLSKFLPIDKTAPIVTFCSGFACHKSHALANKLVASGYTNVKVFAGGLPAWKKKKYPYTGGGSKAKAKKVKKNVKSKSGVLMLGSDTGTVDGEWFIANYKKLPKSVTLVDVRAKEDYAKGTIAGAINIQAEKIKPQELAKMIPQTGDVIFFCGTGTRGMEAVGFLKEINYKRMNNVFYLDANIECDKNNKCTMKANDPVGI